MKSDTYWGKRAAKRMYEYQKKADKVADDIAKAYISSTNYINDEMTKIFRAFQAYIGISEKEARELLNNIPNNEDLNNIKTVIEQINDPVKRRELLDILSSSVYAFRIQRLEQLQKDIDTETAKLADFEQKANKVHYVDLADDAYYRAIFDIQKGTGIGFAFSRMQTSRVEEILRNNWSGKMYSERIWGKSRKINRTLKEELLTQFMTGRSYNKTAAAIESRMAVGAMEARRLIRTESTYIANSAELESIKSIGAKKYKFSAVLDMRTSDVCAAMDGKKFDVDKAVQGTNVPPLHPWCRSMILAVIDGAVTEGLMRSARDPITGKTYKAPSDMTYEQWKKSIDEKYGDGTWETERKKVLKAYGAKKNDVDNSGKSGIIKSGAISGARNPYGDKAQEHAKKYYGLVRSMKTDVSKIAKTTGFSENRIQEVKDFIFNEKHDLGGAEKEHFEPDYMMGESWRRLIDGKPEPHDVTLINHEIMERDLMKKGFTQAEAHIMASKKYDYAREAAEFYDRIEKYSD